MPSLPRSLSSRLVLLPVAVALVLLTTVCGGSGGPTRPRSSVFGVVGGSLSRWAVVGYNELGGGLAWSNAAVSEYGGGHILAWRDDIGAANSAFWRLFEVNLASEPGTDRIWWQILVIDREDPPPVGLSPADRQTVRSVAAEIRSIAGAAVPIFVSAMPDYDPATGCTVAGSAGVEISRLMAEFAVDEGLAAEGPVMSPITTETYNGPGDPCHQGAAGRREHGQALRGFFGG